MRNRYNEKKDEIQSVKDLLKNIPIVKPPSSFEDNLMRNIRSIQCGKDVSILEPERRNINWIVASLSAAAGVVFAFLLLFNSDDAGDKSLMIKEQTIAYEKKIETPADSIQQNLKNNTRKLDLVKGQK